MSHRILIVDDDPAIRHTVQIALSRAGYEVVAAKDGGEAMERWREQPAHLVITDLHMPDKNGLEIILELRALSPATPVVAMSDGGRTRQHELLQDAEKLGAVRTLEKPFRLEELLILVKQELPLE